MAKAEESRDNHLAGAAAKLAAFKQSQPLMEAPMLLAEAIGFLKNNMVEVQYLAVEQNRKKWLEQGC